MGREPCVTVVVPSKDRWELLGQTLTSVLAQRGVGVEVLVVDDGSRRPYGPGLAVLGEPRVRVIRTVGLGLSAARNAGLAESGTEWTAFCDDDDLWSVDKLALQIGALADRPEADWSFCGSVKFDEHGKLFDWMRPTTGATLHRQLLAKNVVPGGGSGVIVRTDRMRSLGGFDPAFTYSEDWDAWLRLSKVTSAAAVDRPLVAYRVHAASMTFTGSPFPALDRMANLYASEREAAGVHFDWATFHYQAGIRAAARGNRVQAFTHLWRSAALGHSLKRRALACLAPAKPQWVYTRNQSGPEQIPSAWPAEVRTWLYPLIGLPAADNTAKA
jgi:glycosyltransferase involved in cell wall biosynthesis